MNKAIFWFRQDLRTYDNRGFIKCLEENEEILPIFILDKNIIYGF
jgi:deoxyribodipyrimidine photo-lyase